MGFDLSPYLNSHTIELQELRNKRVAIDGMNMLYQILYNPYQMQQKLPDVFYLDRTQKVITHLYGWIQKINHFYQAQILPVIVFDGKSVLMKKKPHTDIARNFLHLDSLYKKAMKNGNQHNAKKIALNKQYFLTNCLHESKKLLEMMGIPVLIAPSEAEAQCVALERMKKVDYIVTQDNDVILYGAKKIIRQILFHTRKKINGRWISETPKLELINTAELFKDLRLNREQMIEYSILVGNDYFSGIHNIGPKKAIESLHKFQSILNMKEQHPALFVPLSRSMIYQIKNEFLHPEVITQFNCQIGKFNRLGIEKLLLEDHHLSKDRVESRLNLLEKRYSRMAKDLKIINMKIEKKDRTIFDIHLQRRLDRAKTNFTPSEYKLEFTSSTLLPKSEKKDHYEKQNQIKSKIKHRKNLVVKKIKIRDYLKTKE